MFDTQIVIRILSKYGYQLTKKFSMNTYFASDIFKCIHLHNPIFIKIPLRFVFNVSIDKYRQVSNISCTKPQYLKDSRTILRLSLPNPLKPDIKSRMKM